MNKPITLEEKKRLAVKLLGWQYINVYPFDKEPVFMLPGVTDKDGITRHKMVKLRNLEEYI